MLTSLLRILVMKKRLTVFYSMFTSPLRIISLLDVLTSYLEKRLSNYLKIVVTMEEDKIKFIIGIADILMPFYNISVDTRYWIGCQFALESNYGKSDLAIKNNNYCGMKNPLVRISTSLFSSNGQILWARYSDKSSCVFDYVLCLQYHRPMSVDYDTPEHFARFIKKFYCPERDYIEKINKIYQQFKIHYNEQNK